jgi:hypothetical protein
VRRQWVIDRARRRPATTTIAATTALPLAVPTSLTNDNDTKRSDDSSIPSTPTPTPTSAVPSIGKRFNDDHKRIKSLEKQVGHLEKLLKKKDPTNVNQLLRAVKSDSHEEELIALQQRVKQLEQLVYSVIHSLHSSTHIRILCNVLVQ